MKCLLKYPYSKKSPQPLKIPGCTPETNMAKVILKVTQELSKLHPREITKYFIAKYQQLAKVSKANSNKIYCTLTGHNSAAVSKF